MSSTRKRRAILKRLIREQADVVVQNLAPGASARLGLSYAALFAGEAHASSCAIFPATATNGPYRDKKAYDLLIQSESGLRFDHRHRAGTLQSGPVDCRHRRGYVCLLQYPGGAHASTANTGRGQHLDISMLESLVEWMNYPLYYAFEGASPPPRTGASHATIYPYGPFPAGDGKTVMLGLQNEREWSVFCEKVLLDPELSTDERFSSNSKRSAARIELRNLIVNAFSTLTAEQVVQRLDDAQIANARVNDMHDVWKHPQLQARKRWREVESPAGPIPALLPPGSWEEGEPRMDAVPALGEHTDAILSGLGYSQDEIASLRAAKAI